MSPNQAVTLRCSCSLAKTFAVRRRNEWIVRESHRIVQEERAVPMAFDEPHGIRGEYVGAELAFQVPMNLAVDLSR